MYKKTTLPNGLRIITVPNKNSQSATVMVLVGVGSKYERKQESGISHFVEHLFFKGTQKRPTAKDIAQDLDKIGGSYNAFTSKEWTGYFAKVDKSHFNLALDWVSDIFLNSRLPAKEIEKERGVIIEEINMTLDAPMRYVGDLWEELLYGNQPAGWQIIGSKENILNLKRADFINYINEHYSSRNTVVAVAGNFPQKDIIKIVGKYFKNIGEDKPKEKIKTIERQAKPETLLYYKPTDQSHLCLGARGFDMFSEKRFAQELLAIILGGNMSSRLFLEVREKKGLAYYIHTNDETYTDSGYLVTQAGAPNDKADEAVAVILKEYKRIKERGVSPEELKKAKDYFKGALTLSLEPSDAQAMFFASQEALSGKILTAKEKYEKISKITNKDIQRIAQEIFHPSKINLALIGPHKNKTRFEKILNNF